MSKAIATTAARALARKQENMTQRLAGLSSGESVPFIRYKAGRFLFPDGEAMRGELPVVILDWAFHYSYWSKPYVQGESSAPDCVAVGQSVAEMKPSENSPNIQNDGNPCATCEHNQFGSGGGNRKACKNTVNLAVMRYDDEVEDDTIYFISVPPSALKNWGQYQTKLNEKGLDSCQVVTVVRSDDKVDHYKPTFTADARMTKEYMAEDEDGSSYFASYVEHLEKATQLLLREPSFRTEDDD